MNKKEIEQKVNAAVEAAKKRGDIYYTSDIEGYKIGFKDAIKLFNLDFVIKSEAAVCKNCNLSNVCIYQSDYKFKGCKTFTKQTDL